MRQTYRPMIYVAALVGAGLTLLAFPPFGWWPMVVVGPMVWLVFLRREKGPWRVPCRATCSGWPSMAG